MLTDLLLFVVSYTAQRQFVFARGGPAPAAHRAGISPVR